MSLEARIAQANGRLKTAKCGIQIEAIGDRLYLRGTFPPKPASARTKPYQQRIALGVRANPAGVKVAELEARKVSAARDDGSFSWDVYVKSDIQISTCGEWIERFEHDYFQRRSRTAKTETTWNGDYWKVFKHLPSDQVLTSDLIMAHLLTTAPDTKSRKRACMAFGALAKFAGLDCDLSAYGGNYSPRKVTPRDLPDDALIQQYWEHIMNPAWRWVYGMIATYGLRPHEVFHVDRDRLSQGDRVIHIMDGKTGSRRVWPCFPEWFDLYGLVEVQLPAINLERSNSALGHSCTEYLGKVLPFPLYNLRHCWAIRTIEFGLDVSLAAQQMGHSVQVHTNTYHAWITEKHHQRAYELIMNRPDRPLPPPIKNPAITDRIS